MFTSARTVAVLVGGASSTISTKCLKIRLVRDNFGDFDFGDFVDFGVFGVFGFVFRDYRNVLLEMCCIGVVCTYSTNATHVAHKHLQSLLHCAAPHVPDPGEHFKHTVQMGPLQKYRAERKARRMVKTNQCTPETQNQPYAMTYHNNSKSGQSNETRDIEHTCSSGSKWGWE
jgi:hypothetical protein